MSIGKDTFKRLELAGPMTGKELKKHFAIHPNTRMENTGLLPYLEQVLDTNPQMYVVSAHWEWHWNDNHKEIV